MRRVVRDHRILLQSHHISTTFFSMIENTTPLGSIKCFEATIFDDDDDDGLSVVLFPERRRRRRRRRSKSQKSFLKEE